MVRTMRAMEIYHYIPIKNRFQCLKVYRSTKFETRECKLPPYCGHVVSNTQTEGWFGKLLACYGTGEEIVKYFASNSPGHIVAPRDWYEEMKVTLKPGCELSEDAMFWTAYANDYGMAIVRPAYIMDTAIRYNKTSESYIAPKPAVTGDGRYCLERTEAEAQYMSVTGRGKDAESAVMDALTKIPLYGYCTQPGEDPGTIGKGYRISVKQVKIVKRFNPKVATGIETAVINNLMTNARQCQAYVQTGGLFTGVMIHLFEGIGHLVLVILEQILHWTVQAAEWLLHLLWTWLRENHMTQYVIWPLVIFLVTLLRFNNWTTAAIITSMAGIAYAIYSEQKWINDEAAQYTH